MLILYYADGPAYDSPYFLSDIETKNFKYVVIVPCIACTAVFYSFIPTTLFTQIVALALHNQWLYWADSGCTVQTVVVLGRQWLYSADSGCTGQTVVGPQSHCWLGSLLALCDKYMQLSWHWQHWYPSGGDCGTLLYEFQWLLSKHIASQANMPYNGNSMSHCQLFQAASIDMLSNCLLLIAICWYWGTTARFYVSRFGSWPESSYDPSEEPDIVHTCIMRQSIAFKYASVGPYGD